MATGTSETYKGGCHCGKVRYSAKADLSVVTECNCSICQKVGAMMSFVPAESFTLESGKESLTSYHFNKRKIDHMFCATCGIHAHAQGAGPDGKPMFMINARCLDGFEPREAKVKHHDGRST